MARKEERFERLRVSRFTGLDLNTAKLHMDEGAGRITSNFDFRRIGAARVRAGYARLYVSAAGKVQTVTDNFDRANGSIGANWTVTGFAASTFEVDTNKAKRATGTHSAARYTGSTFQSDQYASAVLTVAFAAIGIGVRVNATQGYFFYGSLGGTGFWYLTRWTYVGTVAIVELASRFGTDLVVSGDTVELQVEGSALRAYVNGTLFLSATDTLLTAGSPALWAPGTATTGRFDYFAAGNIAPLKTAVLVNGVPSRIFAFERDDDESRLIVAHGTRLEQFGETLPEWGT